MQEQKRRTWAEVSLVNIRTNYEALRELLPPGCKFMGMVKSDGYGHGALAVSRKLQELGADYLGVACIDEAIELREGGITLPILILGGTAPEELPLLLQYQLAQTVFDLDMARLFSEGAKERGEKLTVHVKVDTGMTRLGFHCDDTTLVQSAEQIAAVCALEGLAIEGIFTHFADSDGDEAYTVLQMTRFLTLLDMLSQQGYQFAIRHAANSAATLLYPFSHLDMVRPGLALYGHYPGEDMEELCPLQPAMELRSKITAIRELPKGTFVSYGKTYALQRDSRLAVVPIGYGDGYFRSLSNCFSVGLRGKRAPILGRVCMDMCMVDITEIDSVELGEEALIYSREEAMGPTVEEGAALANTVSYELLCALSKRIPRLYQDDPATHPKDQRNID